MRQIEFQVIDPDTAERWPLPDVVTCSLSGVRSSAGAVEFDYPSTGRNFDRIVDHVRRDRDVFVAVRVDGNEIPDLTAIMGETKGDTTQPGAVWTFTGRFLACLLDECIVGPDLVGRADRDPEREFTNATAGTIIRTLVLEGQLRGALAGVVAGSFSSTTDSNGAGWSKVTNINFAPGQSVREVLDKLAELGLCEWEMRGYGLRLYNPGTLGRDLTIGAAPLIFHGPRSLVDAPRTHSVRNSPTSVYVAGKEGLYLTADDLPAQARRGRRIESYVSNGNVSDPGTLAAFAQTTLARKTPGTLQVTHGIAFGGGGPEPYTDFVEGDWAFSDTGQGLERLQIAQWSASVDADGVISGTVTLNDLIASRDAQLSRRLDELTTGGTVVGASTPSPVLEDTSYPSTPLNLLASSSTYVLQSGETKAQVTADWSDVVFNTDGTAVDDLDHYETQWRYAPDQGFPTSYFTVPDSVESGVSFSPIEPGAQIFIRVRSVDRSGNKSDWSLEYAITTANTVDPPPAASKPTVTSFLGLIAVEWDGKGATGEPMPSTFDHAEVHVSNTSDFTPDASTYVAALFGPGKYPVRVPPLYGSEYFAKLVTVNRSNIKASPSEQGSAILLQVTGNDIESLSVGQLTSGIMTALLTVSGIIKTADAGARVELDENGLRCYSSGNVLLFSFNIPNNLVTMTGRLRSGEVGQSRIEIGLDQNGRGNLIAFDAGVAEATAAVGQLYDSGTGMPLANGLLVQDGTTGFDLLNVWGTANSPAKVGAQIFRPDGYGVLSARAGEDTLIQARDTAGTNYAQLTHLVQGAMGLYVFGGGQTVFEVGWDLMTWRSRNQTGPFWGLMFIDAPGKGGFFGLEDGSGRNGFEVLGGGSPPICRLRTPNFAQIVSANAGAYQAIQASAFTVSSGADTKTDFEELPSPALDVLRGAPVSRWRYRDDAAQQHVGPVADDLPEWVKLPPNPDHIEGEGPPNSERVDLTTLVGTLWEAVRELDAELDQHRKTKPRRRSVTELLSDIRRGRFRATT